MRYFRQDKYFCISVNFTPATENKISKCIMHSVTKSSGLNTILTFLLKLILSELLTAIIPIVSTSLASSEIPGQLKLTLVITLWKKALFDPGILRYLRPASYPTFIPKLIAKFLPKHLNMCLAYCNLY